MKTTEKDSFAKSEYAQTGYSPREQSIYFQHHRPRGVGKVYHFHPSIELNFLQDCDMVYSFSGQPVKVKRNRISLFWAAHPHRVTKVIGDGTITVAYISLSEFLLWPLPNDLVSDLLSGAVISSRSNHAGDIELAARWAKEIDNSEEGLQRLHCIEAHARLHRLAFDGWDRLLEIQSATTDQNIGRKSTLQFEKMLRFIANYYAEPIKIADVAEAGDLTPNYAISLFRKMLGRTIKEHITELRMNHARMLLAETDQKILSVALSCGYTTISAFYKSFQDNVGVSPAAFRNGLKPID